MAKATGIVQLSGTLGDLVFYQVDGKTRVRSKPEGMSERVKHDPAYAETRKRNDKLKVANALATAIYRMAKEFATKVDYKKHHQLVKRLYPVIDEEDYTVDWSKLPSALKGFYFNHRDTLPPVVVGVSGQQLIVERIKDLSVPISVSIYAGTSPTLIPSEEKAGLAANRWL